MTFRDNATMKKVLEEYKGRMDETSLESGNAAEVDYLFAPTRN